MAPPTNTLFHHEGAGALTLFGFNILVEPYHGKKVNNIESSLCSFISSKEQQQRQQQPTTFKLTDCDAHGEGNKQSGNSVKCVIIKQALKALSITASSSSYYKLLLTTFTLTKCTIYSAGISSKQTVITSIETFCKLTPEQQYNNKNNLEQQEQQLTNS